MVVHFLIKQGPSLSLERSNAFKLGNGLTFNICLLLALITALLESLSPEDHVAPGGIEWRQRWWPAEYNPQADNKMSVDGQDICRQQLIIADEVAC